MNIEYCIEILIETKEKVINRKKEQMPILTNLIERTKEIISGKFPIDFILNTVDKLNE